MKLKTMTEAELLKFAIAGAKEKICREFGYIADGAISYVNLDNAKKLSDQYKELNEALEEIKSKT